MHFTVLSREGEQRLLHMDTILSIQFIRDAKRGFLIMFHLTNQERLVISGTANQLFEKLVAEQSQIAFTIEDLTGVPAERTLQPERRV